MYLKYFQLNKEPFSITPDPDFLFLSPAHKEALAAIIYGVEQRKGFILILGQIGVGKTTIVRSYLNQLNRSKIKYVYVLNPMLSFPNLLRHICRELELPLSATSSFEMLNLLQKYLVEEFKSGKNVVVIVDEAQNMPIDTLENLRMLSNIETSKEKLIQIVFSAQPEFEKTLNLQELKQLKQRISVKTVISPLDPTAGISYIRSRLAKATTGDAFPFKVAALKNIVRLADGIPRTINILCDNCLINAYGSGQRQVTGAMVRTVAKEYGIKDYFFHKTVSVLSLALLLALSALSFYHLPGKYVDRSFAPPTVATKVAPPPQKRPGRGYIEKVVQRGDTLAKLVSQVYGQADKGRMAVVKKANPVITDENLIVEGLRLRFPLVKDP